MVSEGALGVLLDVSRGCADDHSRSSNSVQSQSLGGETVQLRFLGKATSGGQSPTLYATDRDSYVVQGWFVTDPAVLAALEISEDETVVEIPARLMSYLANDGMPGEVTRVTWPIVHVCGNGNYIIQGSRFTHPEALGQMDIPAHETCVEVPRNVMAGVV
jgi:hypothetical protein